MVRTLLAIGASATLTLALLAHAADEIRAKGIGLGLVAASLGLSLAGALRSRPESPPRSHRALLAAIAVYGLLVSTLFAVQLVWICENLALPRTIGLACGSALALALADYARGPRQASWRFPVALIAFGVLGAAAIRQWPAPPLDVWQLQQDASGQLLHGQNPYSSVHPTIRWNPAHDGLPIRSGAHVRSFPYPPASLLSVLPGYVLAGDVRWSLLAAMVGSSSMLLATGRRLGLPVGHPCELAALAPLLHPWSLFVVATAWTEPLIVLGMALSGWGLARRDQVISRIALAYVVSVKQFGFLWLVPVASYGRSGRHAILVALLLTACVMAPFAFWDPAALWLGNVVYLTSSPLRTDSLSIPAVVAVAAGRQTPMWVGLAAAGAVAAAVIARRPSQLSAVAFAGAAIYLALFLFARLAHANYYWMVGAVLNLAVVASAAEAFGEGRRGQP
jgi:hypothetical protein